MEYLFENPIPLLMVGIVLATFAGVLYFSTKSLPAFLATILIVVVTLAALVMEQLVFTERELVEVALTGISRAAETNDMPGVLAYLSPDAKETRLMVEKIMPQFTIEKANIMNDVQITLDDEKNPKHATAKFRGFFQAKHKGGMAGGKILPVEVDLVRDKHRWMIESYRSEADFEQQAAQLMK